VSRSASCPSCRRIERRRDLIATRESAVAFADLHPLTPGHCLVVPVRHEPDFFELTRDEQDGIWELVWEVRELLMVERRAKAFNIGVNAGAAAGQIVRHSHVHLIPRYKGDVADPRGGVRCLIPDKARYWKS
jgi:diadenosine tetraphosphate (Ap4A) HIT family hydrolase